MATRSLNKVMLIGNLTRDPELRYTPQGTAVCTMGLATNRTWVTEGGDKKEETEFHRIVAWNKLAELCSQLLFKGRRVYVEGRLQTRQWTGSDGSQRVATEIVIEDMIVLDSKRQEEEPAYDSQPVQPSPVEPVAVGGGGGEPVAEEQNGGTGDTQPKKKMGPSKKEEQTAEPVSGADVAEDIPF